MNPLRKSTHHTPFVFLILSIILRSNELVESNYNLLSNMKKLEPLVIQINKNLKKFYSPLYVAREVPFDAKRPIGAFGAKKRLGVY